MLKDSLKHESLDSLSIDYSIGKHNVRDPLYRKESCSTLFFEKNFKLPQTYFESS